MRLWRLAFALPAPLPPALVERLEEMGEALALFVHDEDPATLEPRALRVELWVREPLDPDRWRRELVDTLASFDLPLETLACTPVEERDWVDHATRLRGPVRAGRFFIHGPDERQPMPPGTIPLELEAGLAFGSGEHESTRGCLLALDWLAHRILPARVLDLGTGSGILALAAAHLWPKARVLALDHDPLAVAVARANIRRQGLATHIEVRRGVGVRNPHVRRQRPFDLILANLFAEPLMAMARDLAHSLAPGGRLVLAGLLARQAESVLTAFRRAGLRPLHRVDLGVWPTLVLRRPRNRPHRRRPPALPGL